MLSPRSRLALSLALSLALPFVAASCTTSTEPNGQVQVEVRTDGLLVTNQTGRAITYSAYNPEALMLYAKLVDPCYDRCPTIGAGDQGLVAWTEVAGYDKSHRTYVLSWSQTGAMPNAGQVDVIVPDGIALP